MPRSLSSRVLSDSTALVGAVFLEEEALHRRWADARRSLGQWRLPTCHVRISSGSVLLPGPTHPLSNQPPALGNDMAGTLASNVVCDDRTSSIINGAIPDAGNREGYNAMSMPSLPARLGDQ